MATPPSLDELYFMYVNLVFYNADIDAGCMVVYIEKLEITVIDRAYDKVQ